MGKFKNKRSDGTKPSRNVPLTEQLLEENSVRPPGRQKQRRRREEDDDVCSRYILMNAVDTRGESVVKFYLFHVLKSGCCCGSLKTASMRRIPHLLMISVTDLSTLSILNFIYSTS